MQITIETLSQEDKDGFDSFYAIYAVSFPPSEQKPKEELVKMLHSPHYTVFIATIEAKSVGFCIFFHYEQTSFYLLEYMAVEPSKKGLGIGSKLFIYAADKIFGRYGVKPMLIEIDSPQEKNEEQSLRERRERFYKKLGCRKIEPFDYILAIKSSQVAPSMQLLVYHNGILDISKPQLKEWLEDIYVFVYGCAKDDERIGKMLSDAPQILNLL